MTNRTPEEIARGLTEAQRDFVLGTLYRYTKAGSIAWLHDTRYWPARAVAKKGLCIRIPFEPGTIAFDTPLGLAVRSHLEGHKP